MTEVFQSSPSREAGRCLWQLVDGARRQNVSILAQP